MQGVRAGLDGHLVHDAVDLVRGHARADGPVRGVEDLAAKHAHAAHLLDRLLGENLPEGCGCTAVGAGEGEGEILCSVPA